MSHVQVAKISSKGVKKINIAYSMVWHLIWNLFQHFWNFYECKAREKKNKTACLTSEMIQSW